MLITRVVRIVRITRVVANGVSGFEFFWVVIDIEILDEWTIFRWLIFLFAFDRGKR